MFANGIYRWPYFVYGSETPPTTAAAAPAVLTAQFKSDQITTYSEIFILHTQSSIYKTFHLHCPY